MMQQTTKMLVTATAVAVAIAATAASCTTKERPTNELVGESAQRLTQCVTFQRGANGAVTDAMLSNPPQGQNYGAGPILRVGGKDESLLRFDVSSIPSFAIVDRATLKLYANGSVGNTPINIHRALDAWTEGTVTFASFGQHHDVAVSGIIAPSSPNAFKSADITSLVAAWVSGAQPNQGMLLETSGNQKSIFVSSEGGTLAQHPALEVCYQIPDEHCAPNPCQHGTCNNGWTDYTCTCEAGWTGTNCDVNMHECSTDPCQHGGTCTNLPNDYACACATGYTGKSCETLIDNCAPNPCQNSGVCTNGVGTYTCDCAPGFTGTDCEVNINDCAPAPCVHGACTDGANSYTCACEAGWTGQNCDVNIDDCIGNQCQNGATCVDGIADYTCACLPGWGGVHCEDNLHECDTNPCLNDGACTNGVNSYTCACVPGYTGTNCEIDINECAAQPCQNDALCVDRVAGYSCQCATGWMGAMCNVGTSSAPTVVNVVLGGTEDQVLTSPAMEVVVPAGVTVTMDGVPVTGSFDLSAELTADSSQTFNIPARVDANGDVIAGDNTHPVLPVYRFGPSGATFDPPLQATLVVPNEIPEPAVWLCDDNGGNCEERRGIFYEDTSVSPPQNKLYVEIDHFSTVVVTAQSPLGIRYQGGPVMKDTPNVYFIWYGDWSNNTATTILPDFIQNLGGSPWMKINTGYSDTTGAVTGNLNYGGSVNNSGTIGFDVADSQIRDLVRDSIAWYGPEQGKLPRDPNGIYIVLASPNMKVKQWMPNDGVGYFRSRFCGPEVSWHSTIEVYNQKFKFAFVGNPVGRCPWMMPQQQSSPNGNLGADAMANAIAHEVVSALTNPENNAWADYFQKENADKCMSTFGTTSTLPSGAKYNLVLGSRNYLIQQNWNPVEGACAMSAVAFTGSLLPDGTPCDDNNFCTQSDVYVNGVCVGYNPVVCSTSAPLQCQPYSSCNPKTGLCETITVKVGTRCDDNNPCTYGDSCSVLGTCRGTPMDCGFWDDVDGPCRHGAGTCNVNTGLCEWPKRYDGYACDDGNGCTVDDSCQSGVCSPGTPRDCNPTPCFNGECNPDVGHCVYWPKARGVACDDGNACTQTDTCDNGSCMGSNPKTCTAQDQCQMASCDASTGECVQSVKANNSACNDGNACTATDTCQSGVCTGSNLTCCAGQPDGTPCYDNNACTATDTCQSGVCTGSDLTTCTAQDQCHTASCDATTGQCVQAAKANGSTCDDGNACAQTDTCQNGVCTGSDLTTCTAQDQCHTASCDATTGQCVQAAKANGSTCDDGNACTQTDTCQGGVCMGSNPKTCAALDQCHTAGTCNPSSGACENYPIKANGTACNDGMSCTTDACFEGTCFGTPCNPVATCNSSYACVNDAIAYLKASNTGLNDTFGHTVALSDDGNTLAVAALQESSNATGINGNQNDNTATNAGAVYVFTRSNTTSPWSQQAYIKASNTGANDYFGWSMALSSDGNTLAVGAFFEDSAARGINGNQNDNTANGSGAVYVFTRSGSTWSQQAYIKASNGAASHFFGAAVALSNDGNTLAVGAYGEKSNATGINGDQSNTSLSGAGAVYAFIRSGSTWSQHAYIKASNTGSSDYFGTSVALSSDGNTLAVGAHGESSAARGINGNQNDNSASNAGAVYLFTRAISTWSQMAYVKASNAGSGDLFGAAVALSGEGDTLAVGAYRESSNATGINGNENDNSAYSAGAVYVFRLSPAWHQEAYVKASNTNASDYFGTSIALSSDGNTLAVGANGEGSTATGIGGNQSDNSASGTGAVYVLARNGSMWGPERYVKASNTSPGDQFGISIALSADSKTLVVGADQETSNATGTNGNQTDNSVSGAGAVYTY